MRGSLQKMRPWHSGHLQYFVHAQGRSLGFNDNLRGMITIQAEDRRFSSTIDFVERFACPLV
jgi:hypothetical protein